MKTKKPTSLSADVLQLASLKAAKEQLRFHQNFLKTLKRQLKAERKNGIPNEKNILKELALAKAEFDQSKIKVSKAKTQSKKRKREIDEWKNWYHNLAEIDKSLQLEKLQAEINWRAAEIATIESSIADLYIKRLVIEERIETAKQKLAAIESGIYELSIEEDPRLLSIQATIKQLNATIEVIKP